MTTITPSLTLGDPQVAGPLAVFPLLGPQPQLLDAAVFAPRADLPTPGLGRGLRIVAPGITGSGLEHEGELIQLCAFPAQDEPPRPHPTISPFARPSRRRRSA